MCTYEFKEPYNNYILASHGWDLPSKENEIKLVVFVYSKSDFENDDIYKRYHCNPIFQTSCFIFNPSEVNNIDNKKELCKKELFELTKSKIDKNDLTDEEHKC